MAPDDRRQHILSVATAMLDARPIDVISINAVAQAAGVSAGLLHHYFGTQRKFRHAVAHAAAWDLLSQIAPDPELSPAAQLRGGIDAFVGYVARRPGVYLAVASRADAGLRSLHRTIRSVLTTWLTAGLARAGVPVTPAVTMTIAGWLGFTEEALLDWLTSPRMTQAELVTVCERACYRLVEAAVDDPALWQRVEASIAT